MLQQNTGTHIVRGHKACGLMQPWLAKVVGGGSVDFTSLVERGASTPFVAGSENLANALVADTADLFVCQHQRRVRRPSRR